MKDSLSTPALTSFLADKCDATKAKYAAELENAGDEWKPALDMWYADTLADYFGLLERRVETLYSGKHVRGSRAWFRKARNCSTQLYESTYIQTEMAL